MHPVDPSTMVRGPAAFSISVIPSAGSQPRQVRWPEGENASSGSFFTPLNGSSPWVGRSFTSSANSLSVTAMIFILPWLLAQPDPGGCRLRLACSGGGNDLGHLLHVGDRYLAAAQAGDEADHGRAGRGPVQRRADLVDQHAALVGRAEREVTIDHPHRLEAAQRLRQVLRREGPEPADAHEAYPP